MLFFKNYFQILNLFFNFKIVIKNKYFNNNNLHINLNGIKKKSENERDKL